MVRRTLGEAPEARQLRERGVGMFEAELEHLPERGGEPPGIQALESLLLAGCGGRGTPRVGRVEVSDAIGVGLRLPEDGPGLVLENGVVEAHLGEKGGHPVGALGVGDPPSAAQGDAQRSAREGGDAPDELLVAVYELEVMPAAAARPRQGARTLESTLEVGRSVGGGARSTSEGELLSSLYRA